jgi:FkbM family methyltransferase
MDPIYAAAAALLILGGFSVISLLLWLRRLVGKLESTIKSHANLLDSATVSSSRLDTVIASSGRMDSAIESLSNHIGRKLVEIESKNDILLSHLLNVDVKLFDANENTNLFNRLVERRLNRLHASLDFVRTRLTTYLGNGISITYIGGDIPIYINSNDDGGPTDLINGRDYESGNLSVILSFLAPDSIFLDIGANIGYFTIFAGMHTERTQAKILSFEPNPEMFELLNRSVEVNGLSGRVTTHPFGLAASDEVVSFIIPRHHAGGGHVLRSYGDGQPTGSNTQTRDPMTTRLRVRVKRLDEIVGPEFISDLAKIDVEGGEADVLI